MIENIAILTSAFSIVLAFMSMVTLLLLKKNVKDILSKDAIIFDKNLEIKKTSITKCLKMVDDLDLRGKSLALNPDFADKAKLCYNELLCVITDTKVANEFYNIALDVNYPINKSIITKFKLMCRKDMGFKTKNFKISKNIETSTSGSIANTTAVKSEIKPNISANTSATASTPKPKIAEETNPPIRTTPSTNK